MADRPAIEIVAPTGDRSDDGPLLDAVRAFLAQEEAVNSIQFSLLYGQPGFPTRLDCLVARRDGEVVAVVSYNGTFNAIVSATSDLDAVRALATEAATRRWEIPSVMAPVEVSRMFAEAWRDATGDRIAPGMAQRMLVTSRVVPPSGVPGTSRHAAAGDASFLKSWFTHFAIEADHQPAHLAGEMAASMVQRSVNGMIWIDAAGEPVSIACYKARTPRGMRIGPVYTPPEHRRHGYAAAVTAAVSQFVLDQGCEFVCLYTDATNPTSNHIYESIGYKWVADSMIYRFLPDIEEET
jgi:predicted GNAT family acetyltransferase